MPNFKSPDFNDRQVTSAAAKKALQKKFKAAANDPAASEKLAARKGLVEARKARALLRSKAKSDQEAEKAREDSRAAEADKLSEQLKREEIARGIAEAADRAAALLGEQKAARDVRYAARKVAKKGPTPRPLKNMPPAILLVAAQVPRRLWPLFIMETKYVSFRHMCLFQDTF